MNVIRRGYLYVRKETKRRSGEEYIYKGYILRVNVYADTVNSCVITIEDRELTKYETHSIEDYPMTCCSHFHYVNYNKTQHLIEETNVTKVTLTFFDGFDCDISTITEYVDKLFNNFCSNKINKDNISSGNILLSKEFGLKKGITDFLDYSKYIQPIIKKMIIEILRDKDTICIGLQKPFEDRFVETLANIFVIKYIKPLFKENNEQKECTHVKMRKKM